MILTRLDDHDTRQRRHGSELQFWRELSTYSVIIAAGFNSRWMQFHF